MREFILSGATVRPSYGTQAEHNQNVLVAGFGDGYEQRAPAGINSRRLKLMVRFARVTSAKAKAVLDFLALVGGAEAFLWAAPAPYGDRKRAWILRPPHHHTWEAYDSETVEFILEEELNPVPKAATPVLDASEGDGGAMILTAETTEPGGVIRYTFSAAGEPPDPTDDSPELPGGELTVESVVTEAVLWAADSLGGDVLAFDHLIGAPPIPAKVRVDGEIYDVLNVEAMSPQNGEVADFHAVVTLDREITQPVAVPTLFSHHVEPPAGTLKAHTTVTGKLSSATASLTI